MKFLQNLVGRGKRRWKGANEDPSGAESKTYLEHAKGRGGYFL